ncbi:MAG: HAMP domain-containing sensor histidine kinase [Actinomycetota bacterium]|nr:HAMP domain-containing sensor histidine kinase [Actinomycetota bacterium]
MRNPLVGIRGRVTFTVLAVTAALYSLLGTIGFVQIADSGRDAIRERIAEVLDDLDAAARSGSGTVSLSTADGVDARVVDATVAVAPPASDELQVERPSEIGGRAVVLVGTSSQARLTDSLRSLYRGLWIAIPLAAIVSALMAGLATRRALRPVGAITDLAATIGGTGDGSGAGGSATRAGARVPVPDTGDEIQRLAVTVNEMLDRIEAGRAAQRQFTSDAAHELRTPLMALQGELELVGNHGASVDDELLARLDALCHRLGDRIDDLVLLSTLDEQRPLALAPESLLSIVRDEAATVAPAAVVDGDDHSVALDRALVARAARNLLANARRHAAGEVHATVEADRERLWLLVDDDGPGVDPASGDDVFRRFSRLDEARSSDRGGAGLGLAIVASVAASHDGGVALARSPLGGARLSLWLPMPAADVRQHGGD